ncbi:TM2 domain-containing protein [Gluconacetobacter diazotrophicus]|uniref:TM2 domain-containing protein n=1 Tax=Gluconacetobacter diazotrophicus TaxID=33996 RepID=A0A7W4NIS6_GLUDI|nr:TM2 domain-containing protein [Gluconacetobacter diazotrophicus]MBB2158519.1 TM2 domain-containing protein [Gluconacetobacter diazotrophicus]
MLGNTVNQKSYLLEFQNIIWSLPDEIKNKYLASFAERERNPVVAFGLSGFLGMLGVDRFYVGDTMLGVIKLITCGGLGIWALIDLFLIAGLTV